MKTWIQTHLLDLKNALHPWELLYQKRVGFWGHWKVLGVMVVAVERVDDGGKL